MKPIELLVDQQIKRWELEKKRPETTETAPISPGPRVAISITWAKGQSTFRVLASQSARAWDALTLRLPPKKKRPVGFAPSDESENVTPCPLRRGGLERRKIRVSAGSER